MTELNPTVREKAFIKAGVGFVGSLGVPEGLHIELTADKKEVLKWSTSQGDQTVKFERELTVPGAGEMLLAVGIPRYKD